MSGIGGFLPLEAGTAAGDDRYHDGGLALASGRACWHVVLRASRPSRVLLPFYICDAMIAPLAATGTAFDFYPITDAFQPDGAKPASNELMVVVNYFGMQTGVVESFARANPSRVVIDDTQAFFHRGTADVWSFNSARKFFGVPDGAYLYGPSPDLGSLPPSDIDDCDHLIARRDGDDDLAWSRFKAHEARVGIEPRAMSAVSTRLLASVGMAAAACRRRTNFAALHQLLARVNTIELPLALSDEGPLCYPFLSARDVDRAALTRLGLFVPTLWPEIDSRAGAGFERERRVARRLLPLPIDHRYGPAEMATVARTILQVLQ